jgi:hypothetical protein
MFKRTENPQTMQRPWSCCEYHHAEIVLNSSEKTLRSAALTGGFVDRIAETKGMDAVDKEKAKHAGAIFNR